MVEYINFHTVAAFLNALMLGAMSFFTLALAPVVFRALEREQAHGYCPRFFRCTTVSC